MIYPSFTFRPELLKFLQHDQSESGGNAVDLNFSATNGTPVTPRGIIRVFFVASGHRSLPIARTARISLFNGFVASTIVIRTSDGADNEAMVALDRPIACPESFELRFSIDGAAPADGAILRFDAWFMDFDVSNRPGANVTLDQVMSPPRL